MTSTASLNTNYHLQVISTSTSDSSPSVLVTFDNHRYLFNTPESISRIFVQNRIGMKKISKAFIGDLEKSAGLPGFILSTVEAGNHVVELVGPEGLDHLVATYRFFTRREQLSLKITVPPALAAPSTAPTLPEPIHADPNLIVYALPLSSSEPLRATLPNSKRLRSRSPSPPPKPSKSPWPTSPGPQPSSNSITSQLPPVNPSLDTNSSSFHPPSLVGSHAAEWRSLVLADMFRGKKFHGPSPSDNIVVDAETSTEPVAPKDTMAAYRAARNSQTPSYLPLSLPRFELTGPRTVISYLGVGPALRGKFLPQEAKKRGVKEGRSFAKLVAGGRVWVPKVVEESKEVTEARLKLEKERRKGMSAGEKKKEDDEKRKVAELVEDGVGEGTWVESSDCLGPGQEGNAFLLLNIPSPDFLPSLLSQLSSSLFADLNNASLQTIFYFLGPGVLHDPSIHTFMSTFPPTITHRFCSPDLPNSDTVTFVPSALLSLRLSYLSPTIFHLPQYTFPSPTNPTSLPPNFPAQSCSILLQHDRFGRSTTPTPSIVDARGFNFDVPSEEASTQAGLLKGPQKTEVMLKKAADAWAEYVPAAGKMRLEVEQEEKERKEKGGVMVPGDDLRVTPLGTGSAVPSKYRNVSSTLLHLPEGKGYILLDAGEGTWGQIARRFGSLGEESAEKVLRELKCIFISHMHQDHHAGLSTLLRERSKLSTPPTSPLTIIGPPGILTYLLEQQALFDLGFGPFSRSGEPGREICFVQCYGLEAGKYLKSEESRTMSDLLSLLELSSIATVPVLHRCRCWGVVIEHQSGWKAVFSGDTMPCEGLVVAGQGASLLIHEATIEDDMPEVARAKGHSTFAQAIDIARRMKARHCLLTHFSARYPKLPPVTRADPSSPEGTFEPTVAIAFDLCTLRLDEFWKMERYRTAMDLLFAWDEEDDDDAEGSVVATENVAEVKSGKGKEKGKGRKKAE